MRWNRFRLAVVPDDSTRPIAAKLLDRPDLIDALRVSFAGRPAFIEPWNVTQREVAVAERLQLPIDGPASISGTSGSKALAGGYSRRPEFRRPAGREDVRTIDQVVAAIAEIRAAPTECDRRGLSRSTTVVLETATSSSGLASMTVQGPAVMGSVRAAWRWPTGIYVILPLARSWRSSLPGNPLQPARVSRLSFRLSAK